MWLNYVNKVSDCFIDLKVWPVSECIVFAYNDIRNSFRISRGKNRHINGTYDLTFNGLNVFSRFDLITSFPCRKDTRRESRTTVKTVFPDTIQFAGVKIG